MGVMQKKMIKEISTLGIRLLAAYVIIQGITGVVVILSALTGDELVRYEDFVNAQLAMLLGPFVVGILIFALSKPLGNLIAHGSSSPQSAIGELTLLSAGTSLIGLFLIATAIPKLAGTYAIYREASELAGMLSTGTAEGFVTYGVQLLVGMLLIIGRRGLAKLMHFIRYVGTNA
jgi:hypothetical protein